MEQNVRDKEKKHADSEELNQRRSELMKTMEDAKKEDLKVCVFFLIRDELQM